MFDMLINAIGGDELDYDVNEMNRHADETEKRYRAYCAKHKTTPKDFLQNCLDVQYERIKDKPIRYRAYGGYWWALKKLLIAHGYDFGVSHSDYWQQIDETLAEHYKGKTDLHTVLLADRFFNRYYPSHVVGSNTFNLVGVGMANYTLKDLSMELLL